MPIRLGKSFNHVGYQNRNNPQKSILIHRYQLPRSWFSVLSPWSRLRHLARSCFNKHPVLRAFFSFRHFSKLHSHICVHAYIRRSWAECKKVCFCLALHWVPVWSLAAYLYAWDFWPCRSISSHSWSGMCVFSLSSHFNRSIPKAAALCCLCFWNTFKRRVV